MGLLSLTYRRPRADDDVPIHETSSSIGEKSNGSLRSGTTGVPAGIPESLSFEKIMDGGTCPPCTIRDFMNYLIYIEHSAENLQFFLWFKDYQKRFANAKTTDMSLAPEWTQEMEDEAITRMQKEKSSALRPQQPGDEIFKGTDFDKKLNGDNQYLLSETLLPGSPPRTPASGNDQESFFSPSNTVQSTADTYRSQASEAFLAAGAKQPFTVQPFRGEIDRIIATYLMEGAPRQLNISSRERNAALNGLAHTTHPSALRIVFRAIEHSLKHQAHPKFIRWSICNGNPARVFFARFLGTFLITASLAVATILTLGSVPRGYRAIPAAGLVLGVSTLVAAWKGMCVVLHGMHHRHVRPWELFVDEEGENERSRSSFDSFGSKNSYEDEPWIVRYEKRNVVRKVFDREVWIQEPALRQIQDTIFVQAILCGLLVAGVLTAIFVTVPAGRYY